jgi:hypothetical protein
MIPPICGMPMTSGRTMPDQDKSTRQINQDETDEQHCVSNSTNYDKRV